MSLSAALKRVVWEGWPPTWVNFPPSFQPMNINFPPYIHKLVLLRADAEKSGLGLETESLNVYVYATDSDFAKLVAARSCFPNCAYRNCSLAGDQSDSAGDQSGQSKVTDGKAEGAVSAEHQP